jgi:phosphatidate phosphatase APP1
VIDADVTADLAPGWHRITLSMAGAETVTAPVFVSDPTEPIGIISDIDDTVMVTALPRPFLAAWNTFVLNEHARTAVPGMSVLYERLIRHYEGAPVVYLSTGAWNVAPTLTRFLSRNLYPPGALLLTDWGPTHDRWFRSGKEHKAATLRRLASEFPNVRWLLIGDDGQHDEDIYGDFAREHPTQVAAVAIRQLSTSEAVLAGGRSKASDRASETSVPWVYAPDGAGLSEQLAAAGLLSDGQPATEPTIEPAPEQSAPPRPEPSV